MDEWGEERKPKRRRLAESPDDIEDRQTFSHESRSRVARERMERRQEDKALYVNEGNKFDVYGVGLDHPSGRPPCGIAIQDGDDKGRDCWTTYSPGTLMGPPLEVRANYQTLEDLEEPDISQTPLEREYGRDLIELAYMAIVRKYIRLYLDIRRQRKIMMSQEPTRDELPVNDIRVLSNHLIFSKEVLDRLPIIVLIGLRKKRFKNPRNQHLNRVPKKLLEWGEFWRDQVHFEIDKTSEYLSELSPHTFTLPKYIIWPLKISPEFKLRKDLYDLSRQLDFRIVHAYEKARNAFDAFDDELERLAEKHFPLKDSYTARGMIVGRYYEPEDPEMIRMISNNSRMEKTLRRKLTKEYKNFANRIGELADHFHWNYKRISRDLFEEPNWYVYRDPSLYARVYAVLRMVIKSTSNIPSEYDENTSETWFVKMACDFFTNFLNFCRELPQNEKGEKVLTERVSRISLSSSSSSSSSSLSIHPTPPDNHDMEMVEELPYKGWGEIYSRLRYSRLSEEGMEQFPVREANTVTTKKIRRFMSTIYWQVG